MNREERVGRHLDDYSFQNLVDELFNDIEDALDELEDDLDIDSGGGLLNVNLPDGSAIVLSRQPAAFEIWVAAKSGGYHLGYRDDNWYCASTSETLAQLVNRVFTEQLGHDCVVL